MADEEKCEHCGNVHEAPKLWDLPGLIACYFGALVVGLVLFPEVALTTAVLVVTFHQYVRGMWLVWLGMAPDIMHAEYHGRMGWEGAQECFLGGRHVYDPAPRRRT